MNSKLRIEVPLYNFTFCYYFFSGAILIEDGCFSWGDAQRSLLNK